jgi:hypothetical protein
MQEPAIAVEPLRMMTVAPRRRSALSYVLAAMLGVTVYTAVIVDMRPSQAEVHARAWEPYDKMEITIRKYAYEAFPKWAADHPGSVCPRSLNDLDRYMDQWHEPDPWGHDYVMTCADGKVYVASRGADGASNTADDIWSHQ